MLKRKYDTRNGTSIYNDIFCHEIVVKNMPYRFFNDFYAFKKCTNTSSIIFSDKNTDLWKFLCVVVIMHNFGREPSTNSSLKHLNLLRKVEISQKFECVMKIY